MTPAAQLRLKRFLPVAFIVALAIVQAWIGGGDASATGASCEPFTGDPSKPMTELLKPPPESKAKSP